MTEVTDKAIQLQATSTTPVVKASRLAKWIDERPVLRGVDLEVNAGEFVALLGANGAGKSTLLKILATLSPVSAGKLELFGRIVKGSDARTRARIGMVGHQSMLYRDLSAWENLEFFAKLYGVKDVEARCHRLLKMVGLLDRANDPVKTFSRGMTQRVSIARALLHDPELILADEPFAGLDPGSAAGIERLFNELNLSGKTIVLVNHDIEQSLRVAGRAVVLRDGNVVVDEPTFRLYAREVLSEVCS